MSRWCRLGAVYRLRCRELPKIDQWTQMRPALRLRPTASPTLVFNENRQRLTGNVGYRIIEATVRELLESPEGQNSWC